MRVTSFPRNDHTNGWFNVLDHPPANAFAGEHKADWVVVGGGYSGLAAARRLGELRPDERIVLLEAGRIGENSSGRNSGFAIDLPHSLGVEAPEHDHRQIRLNRTAIAWLSELVERHQIRCQWSHRGKVHCAATARGRTSLADMARRMDSIGEACELWDHARISAYLGTQHFQEAIFTPGCILMQPAALVCGLARSMPANVEVYENSAVLEFEDGGHKHLKTASGSVTTPHVILSTNGWTPGFGFLTRQLETIFTFGSLTRPLDEAERRTLGGEGDWGVIPATMGGTTMRYTQDHRLLIRKNVKYRPDFNVSGGDMAAVRASHVKTLRQRFPNLPNVDFENTWGGVLCLSRNHVPKCGRLADGVWAAVCQNGVGVARGTISGRAVAEMAAGHDSEIVHDMAAYEDLTMFPPRWMTGIGMRARLAKTSLLAGREA